MKRYNYITLMKIITMFLVILSHCSMFFSDNEFWYVYAEQKNTVINWMSNFVVLAVIPIFTFASGFLFQVSLQKNKVSTVQLIKKKAMRLLIPYFIYGIIWLVPTYTFFDIPSFGRDQGASLMDGYMSMALGKFSDMAWFLLMMFWVTLVWILLNSLLKKDNIIYGALVSVALYIMAHFFLGQIDYYKISQIDIYIIVFFAGAAFFYIADIIYQSVSKYILIAGSMAGMAVCGFLAQLSSEIYILDCILKIVIPLLMVCFTMGINQIKIVGMLEDTAFYNWLYKNNMYIYLFQAPGVYVLFDVIYPMIGANAWLCFLGLFILTILLDLGITVIYVFMKEKISCIFASDS